MPISKLSEVTIRRNANAKSFERGEAYYQAGAVVAPTYRGNTLQATVEGSEAQPDRVSLCFDGGGITSEGQTQQYLTMLSRLRPVEEAMKAAQAQMTSMEEAFALAQTLREQGALVQALEIAQTGLTLPGNCQYDLATWTSDLAEGLGDRQAALTARAIAFQAKPSFRDYLKVEDLAGKAWSTVKANLLAKKRVPPICNLDSNQSG